MNPTSWHGIGTSSMLSQRASVLTNSKSLLLHYYYTNISLKSTFLVTHLLKHWSFWNQIQQHQLVHGQRAMLIMFLLELKIMTTSHKLILILDELHTLSVSFTVCHQQQGSPDGSFKCNNKIFQINLMMMVTNLTLNAHFLTLVQIQRKMMLHWKMLSSISIHESE